MSGDRYADRAARWLRAARANVGPRAPAEPERAIAALASAIRGSARRRRARVWLASAVAVASAAAAAAVLAPWAHAPASGRAARRPELASATAERPAAPRTFTIASPTSASFTSAAGRRLAAAGAPFVPGDSLVSNAGAVTLASADGTAVGLAPGSEVALVRADAIRWFRLQTGSLDAHVTKLAPGERFVVATPDRQVEVRGTRFRVSLAPADSTCGGGTVTRVVVDEGVVTVRASGGSEARVAAGQRWPADCALRAKAADSEVAVEQAAPDRPRKLHVRSASQATPTPARAEERPSASTLGAENDLFGQAVRAERASDSRAALRLLDLLLARFPSSPLREAAEAERHGILNRSPAPPSAK